MREAIGATVNYGVPNLNTVTSFVASSTAARRVEYAPAGAVAIPNAAPAAESIENSAMNLPFFVNSTISLFNVWVEGGETDGASPLLVSRSPLGANANASGPRK